MIAGNKMYLNPGGAEAGNFEDATAYTFTQLSNDIQSVAVADIDRDVRATTASERHP